MFEVVVGGSLLAAGIAAVAARRPHHPTLAERVSTIAGDLDAIDLPCPWCLAATTEHDVRCPSCHQRFG
jgi:hypothetical protein